MYLLTICLNASTPYVCYSRLEDVWMCCRQSEKQMLLQAAEVKGREVRPEIPKRRNLVCRLAHLYETKLLLRPRY